MADLSWENALILADGEGGGTGTSNYDRLSNRPIQNVSGNPVIITQLPSGVYNIDGTWAMTTEAEPKATYRDDMFYVLNEDGICKMTWITAGEIYTYSVQNGAGTPSVVEDRVTKESDCQKHGGSDADDLIGVFGDSGDSSGDFSDLFGVF